MFKPLWWFLKCGARCPEGKRSDKYFTAISFSFILISSILILHFWLLAPHDLISHFLIFTAALLFYSSGLIYVLLNKDTLLPFMNQMTAQNDLPSNSIFEELILAFFIGHDISRIMMYLNSFGKSPFIAILAGVGINFVNAPLVQQLLIVHQLTTKFSVLNDRLGQKSSVEDIRTYLPILFKDHAQLRSQVAQISSYFATYNLLSLSARLIQAPMNVYWMIILFSRNNSGVRFTDVIGVIFMVLTVFVPCEICHKCVVEVSFD